MYGKCRQLRMRSFSWKVKKNDVWKKHGHITAYDRNCIRDFYQTHQEIVYITLWSSGVIFEANKLSDDLTSWNTAFLP